LAVRVLMILAVFVFFYGCGQENRPPPEEPETSQEDTAGVEETQRQTRQEQEADLPAYEVTGNERCTEGGIPGTCLYVSTDATSRRDFAALTMHFRDEHSKAKAVFITFLPNKSAKEASGFGAWFATKEAARAFAGPKVTDSEIQKIMDDGGLLVIAPPRGPRGVPSEETTESTTY
jgi:hypothetical protein